MAILLRYLRRHASAVSFAMLMALVNQTCLLLDPLILQHLLDKFAVSGHGTAPRDFLEAALLGFAAIIGSVFCAWLAKGFQIASVNRVAHMVGANMFSDGMRSSLRMPFHRFEKRRSGESVEGLRRLRRDVEDLLKTFINNIFTSLIAIVFIVVYTAHIYWVLAPAFLTLAPILAYISLVLSRRMRKVDEELHRRNLHLSGSATETLRNVELVKSMGLTEQELSKFDDQTAAILRLELEKVRTSRVYTFFHGACVHGLRVSLLMLLLYLRFIDKITMGQFLSVYLYSYFVFTPMQEFGTLLLGYRESETSLRQFAELLKEDNEHQGQGISLPHIESLAFDAVGFRYGERRTAAAHDISFAMQKGEIVAFVGPSGAGKTTLVKLISALYKPAEGHVLFNGISVDKLDADSLRLRMGLVTQDTQLFSGSIRENLLVVKPDATDAEMLEKLSQAAADGVIQRAPHGLDTVIGEGGLRLSGGERQRLAIARALLRDPDLIIFDEATSSLDALVEREIADTFIGAARQRHIMAIVIAHRLSTVVRADRIYVLDHGSIVESGTHAELVENEGLYHRLWQSQMGALEVEAVR